MENQKDSIEKEIQALIERFGEKITTPQAVKEKIMFLYQVVTSREIEDRDKVHSTANEILEILFHNPLIEDTLIPLSFMNTAIGKILGQAKYGIAEKIYTVSEVAIITGKSASRIHQEVGKRLRAEKRKGATIIYESALNDYLKREDIPLENKERIKNI